MSDADIVRELLVQGRSMEQSERGTSDEHEAEIAVPWDEALAAFDRMEAREKELGYEALKYANEVERLREMHTAVEFYEDNLRLRAENEQLRESETAWANAASERAVEMNELRNEVERLRAALEEICDGITHGPVPWYVNIAARALEGSTQ